MTDRPTPERALVDFFERVSDNPLGTPIYTTATPEELALSLLDKLADDLGYVIAHPDDTPKATIDYDKGRFQRAWDEGYNACRRRIFGEES